MSPKEMESIARVRALLDAEARACPALADLWAGWSEDLRRLVADEPVAGRDDE